MNNFNWYYAGGNKGEHLRFFRLIHSGQSNPRYPDLENEYCYICKRNLYNSYKLFKDNNEDYDPFFWDRSEIYYIYDILNDKFEIIGKCCIEKFYPVKKIYNLSITKKINKIIKIKID